MSDIDTLRDRPVQGLFRRCNLLTMISEVTLIRIISEVRALRAAVWTDKLPKIIRYNFQVTPQNVQRYVGYNSGPPAVWTK